MKFLIVIVSIFALSAVIGAVYVGSRTFDGTVVSKPYEHGLAYDAAKREVELSGWKTEIINRSFFTGKNIMNISATDRTGAPLSGIDMTLTIGRPSSSSYDMVLKPKQSSNGIYAAEVDLPLYGYWEVKIQIADRDRNITFDKKSIFAEKR